MEQKIKNEILGVILATIYCVFLLLGVVLVFFSEQDLWIKIVIAIILLGHQLISCFIVWLNSKEILDEFRRTKKWNKK